jgi:hypothetical protein
VWLERFDLLYHKQAAATHMSEAPPMRRRVNRHFFPGKEPSNQGRAHCRVVLFFQQVSELLECLIINERNFDSLHA